MVMGDIFLVLLVAIAQFGRALLCESSCRGFEPRYSPPQHSSLIHTTARWEYDLISGTILVTIITEAIASTPPKNTED